MSTTMMATSFGVIVAVFQNGWGAGPVNTAGVGADDGPKPSPHSAQLLHPVMMQTQRLRPRTLRSRETIVVHQSG
jgi:hypothetical protein